MKWIFIGSLCARKMLISWFSVSGSIAYVFSSRDTQTPSYLNLFSKLFTGFKQLLILYSDKPSFYMRLKEISE